jgi:coenzyme F420-reducing hydrogenase alpha subunit
MKIIIPHIHKIEGEAGLWAKVAKTGKIEELKLKSLEGLRQIEGIVIGRRVKEVPLVISRVCGICPVVHILNAVSALEKALEVKVSRLTVLLRKLMLASQIIQSHALHLFFMSLADFFDIENDLDLMKRFPKEAKATLKVRNFALKITKTVGGRAVHPLTPTIGGFTKLPEKSDLKKILNQFPQIFESALFFVETFKDLSYPVLNKKINFLSLFSKKDYPFYQSDTVKGFGKEFSIGDFYSNQIEEDLKAPPVKKVTYRGKPYMLGAIARLRNNGKNLSPKAKKIFEEFKKKNNLSDRKFFENVFYNLFAQAVEILHFLKECEKLLKEILEYDLKESVKEIKISQGSGLSAMEAPRGTLFTYFEVDKQGRILNCNIVTPSAQFLANTEDDLKILLPKISNLSEKEKKRKIRSLIRAYDPCISCATH